MGAAGDMLTAALLEIICKSAEPGVRLDRAKAEAFLDRFRAAGIPGVEMKIESAVKQGITGTHVRILVDGEEEPASYESADHAHSHDHDHTHEYVHSHHDHEHVYEHAHTHENEHTHDHGHAHAHSEDSHVHRSMADIEALISGLELDADIKKDIIGVYSLIAEAEGTVHGESAGEVHFHEVGTMDAIADVTAVCMLMHEIAPYEIVASPVATGYGTVRCAHGVLPVPAPATALLLQGIPAYAGDIRGELCTPTGAALLKYFVQKYSQMRVMTTEAIGYGMGTRDFEKANCIRVFYGESF